MVVFPFEALRQCSTFFMDPILAIIIGACVGGTLFACGAASIALEGTPSPQQLQFMAGMAWMMNGAAPLILIINHAAPLCASQVHLEPA